MRVLISETDAMAAALLAGRVEALGHESITRHMDLNALESHDLSPYDVLMVAPPHPVARLAPFMAELRETTRRHPYIVLLAPEPEAPGARAILPPEAAKNANAILKKPFDFSLVSGLLADAQRLTDFMTALEACIAGGLELEAPIPGALEPAAFGQVLFSALDRIARGRGGAGLVSVRMGDGDVQALGATLVELHRKSEILGRVGARDFALLLQNTADAGEAAAMAARLAEGLHGAVGLQGAEITLTAVALPGGQQIAEHRLAPGP